jgi:hypothetical protein
MEPYIKISMSSVNGPAVLSNVQINKLMALAKSADGELIYNIKIRDKDTCNFKLLYVDGRKGNFKKIYTTTVLKALKPKEGIIKVEYTNSDENKFFSKVLVGGKKK